MIFVDLECQAARLAAADLDRWFADDVLTHERALSRYLQLLGAHEDEMHDLRQETYARVYAAARKERPAYVKAFLFTTARHLAVDRARRAALVSIQPIDEGALRESLVDEVTPERHALAREYLSLILRAMRRLPHRCREVVWLRRVDELSQKEVARRLGVSDRTVETHLANGMRLVMRTLRACHNERRGESA